MSSIAATSLSRPLLTLGHVVATPGAIELLAAVGVDSGSLVNRHARGDWGDLSAHDRAANEAALRDEERVVSAYTLGAGERVWIITEADRSSTTLLLPGEY